MSAFLFGYWPRDEYVLDKLVNKIEGYMSKESGDPGRELDVDGIIVGKNPVGLIDEMCKTGKTGKLKGLKYTYWEDNIASHRAQHQTNVLMYIFKECITPPTVDMYSAVYMLQGNLDFFNTFLHQREPLVYRPPLRR